MGKRIPDWIPRKREGGTTVEQVVVVGELKKEEGRVGGTGVRVREGEVEEIGEMIGELESFSDGVVEQLITEDIESIAKQFEGRIGSPWLLFQICVSKAPRGNPKQRQVRHWSDRSSSEQDEEGSFSRPTQTQMSRKEEP